MIRYEIATTDRHIFKTYIRNNLLQGVINPDVTGIKSISQPDSDKSAGMNTAVDFATTNTHEMSPSESDALWDQLFATSQDFLQQLADEARTDYLAGLTEEFDSEIDSNVP